MKRTLLTLAVALGALTLAAQQPSKSGAAKAAPKQTAKADPNQLLVTRYCVSCHNDRLKTGGMSFEGVDLKNVAAHSDAWEKAVRKLDAGMIERFRTK